MEQLPILELNLDLLNDVIPLRKLLQFRYSHDEDHDFRLLKWFCENGELRAHRQSSNNFNLVLTTKNGLQLSLGSIGIDMVDTYWCNEPVALNDYDKKRIAGLKNRLLYIKYVWENLLIKDVTYCTNNLLKTPDEVTEQFRGNSDYTFSNSSETAKSMIKNKHNLVTILNILT